MHAVTTQVRSDLKVAKKLWLPWRYLPPLMVISFCACVLFDHYGMLNMALPLLNCIGVFGLLINQMFGRVIICEGRTLSAF